MSIAPMTEDEKRTEDAIFAILDRAKVEICNNDPFAMTRHIRSTNADAPLTGDEKRMIEEYFATRRLKYGGLRIIVDD